MNGRAHGFGCGRIRELFRPDRGGVHEHEYLLVPAAQTKDGMGPDVQKPTIIKDHQRVKYRLPECVLDDMWLTIAAEQEGRWTLSDRTRPWLRAWVC